jgi:hypothetical protein
MPAVPGLHTPKQAQLQPAYQHNEQHSRIHSHQQPVVVVPAILLPASSQLQHATINLNNTKPSAKSTLFADSIPTAIRPAKIKTNHQQSINSCLDCRCGSLDLTATPTIT